MVLLVRAGVVYDPVVPVLPPGAEHEVLLVDVQAITEVAPLAIEDGVAVRVTVGVGAGAGAGDAAATVMVKTWLAVPPGPVQVTV